MTTGLSLETVSLGAWSGKGTCEKYVLEVAEHAVLCLVLSTQADRVLIAVPSGTLTLECEEASAHLKTELMAYVGIYSSVTWKTTKRGGAEVLLVMDLHVAGLAFLSDIDAWAEDTLVDFNMDMGGDFTPLKKPLLVAARAWVEQELADSPYFTAEESLPVSASRRRVRAAVANGGEGIVAAAGNEEVAPPWIARLEVRMARMEGLMTGGPTLTPRGSEAESLGGLLPKPPHLEAKVGGG